MVVLMPTLDAKKCTMCAKHDMVPVKTFRGDSPDYVWCRNCDNPDGLLPNQLT